MGTKKNDIALSFDKAEYYTLQEASEYLNRKHGIDNITPKRLLKHIASYDINTYVHFRMDNLKEHEKLFFEFDFYNSNIFETDENIYQYDSQDSYLSDKVAICDKVNKYISDKLKDDLYMGFILFLIDERTIQNMALSTKQKNDEVLFCFDGFIYRDNLNDNPESPKQLKEWAVTVDDKEYYIYDVANLSIKILSKEKAILDDFKSKIPFPCDFYTFDEWDIVIVILNITIDDLIILHKDLEILENQILENAPIPPKELKSLENTHQKMHPRAENNYAKIISALANMADVNVTEPYGKDNKAIIETMERLGLENIPSSDTIAKALKQAHEISK